MDETPRWIPRLVGTVMILMASLVLGALSGFVPTDGGRFLAPPVVIAALGLCLLAGGIALWLPLRAPAVLRTGFFGVALGSLVIVCNWTAFAPEVTYFSSSSLGPGEPASRDQIGGRIVFGLAAIVIDIFTISVIAGALARRSRRAGGAGSGAGR